MPMDPELRYDQLKAPFKGHALVDLVVERYNSRYDFSGGMSFETPEEMKETAKFYDTLAPDEDKEMDRWTGFPKNEYTYDQMVARHSDWPTWDEVIARYDEYVVEYNAYEGKRARNYPALKEQLDMLYHAIDDGLLGDAAKTSDFYTTLKTIKDENQ